MRMWMVDPRILCRKHLMGEHVETHMFLGHMKLKRRVDKFISNNLFEPKSLKARHDRLAWEMQKRGYNHYSLLDTFEADPAIHYLSDEYQNTKVNVGESEAELIRRCPECRKRKEELNV